MVIQRLLSTAVAFVAFAMARSFMSWQRAATLDFAAGALPTCSEYPALCSPALVSPRAPPLWNPTAGYKFGRSTKPLARTVQLQDHGWLHEFCVDKTWHFMSFDTDRYFVALAFAELHYVGDAFVYVVDKKGNVNHTEHWVRPGGLGISTSDSSLRGCSSVRGLPMVSSGRQAQVCFNDGYHMVKATFPSASGGTVELSLWANTRGDESQEEQALVLVYPLYARSGDRTREAAYVHKGAGFAVHGNVTVNGEVTTVVGAATIDWTRAHTLHHTEWLWASLAMSKAKVVSEGSEIVTWARFGINLSERIYDVETEDGVRLSAENAVWLNGTMFPIEFKVAIIPAEDLVAGTWRILGEGNEGIKVDLSVSPRGGREDHTDLSAVGLNSDFVQLHGVFEGTVTLMKAGVLHTIHIESGYGLVEAHDARW